MADTAFNGYKHARLLGEYTREGGVEHLETVAFAGVVQPVTYGVQADALCVVTNHGDRRTDVNCVCGFYAERDRNVIDERRYSGAGASAYGSYVLLGVTLWGDWVVEGPRGYRGDRQTVTSVTLDPRCTHCGRPTRGVSRGAIVSIGTDGKVTRRLETSCGRDHDRLLRSPEDPWFLSISALTGMLGVDVEISTADPYEHTSNTERFAPPQTRPKQRPGLTKLIAFALIAVSVAVAVTSVLQERIDGWSLGFDMFLAALNAGNGVALLKLPSWRRNVQRNPGALALNLIGIAFLVLIAFGNIGYTSAGLDHRTAVLHTDVASVHTIDTWDKVIPRAVDLAELRSDVGWADNSQQAADTLTETLGHPVQPFAEEETVPMSTLANAPYLVQVTDKQLIVGVGDPQGCHLLAFAAEALSARPTALTLAQPCASVRLGTDAVTSG